MNFDRVANILGAIVTVALVTTLVAHRQTANVVRAFGNAFTNALLAAQGITRGRRV